MLTVDKDIFREYDIRGQYPLQLNESTARLIGKALGSEILMAGQYKCYIAWDGRLSSPSLRDALVSGLASTGCHVKLIGACPTAVAFYSIKQNMESCAIITGSHNPKQDNGIKIAVAGKARSGEDIQVLLSRIQLGLFEQGLGLIEPAHQLMDEYLERITQGLKLKRPIRVVLDAGNGIGGPIAMQALEKLGVGITPIACNVDGEFPLHHPDPAKSKNLKWLQRAVLKEKADFGIALDGDADRIGVVDNKGEVVLPDRLSLLFVRDILSKQPGQTVLFDVKCTDLLIELTEQLGGHGKMIATGHTSMKRGIREDGAAFATELSGHIIFNDEHGIGVDDGIYAALRLCELASRLPDDLNTNLKQFPQTYSSEEIQVPVSAENKFSLMKMIQSHCFKEQDRNQVDGIRVRFYDQQKQAIGWALVRASNTTACLTLRTEAKGTDELNSIKHQLIKELTPYIQNIADYIS
ncbi:phosphomannomutase/phosphoglucomutase [Bermanella marisrubri]|uniref:phosphomannomutase n=1 Tax=Bermanella marisrubri TaxID=207949 RepID=Q1N4C6_9GAMM|nr:phosphomannomutase/phosphoglucomutase [Bermanella marisrubri]EAT12939.1 Phosphomannomutase [Oceanobacter sp. RED65] [Bermanella marisrubri]QIZ82930.1 phosphomannomutase/phosphoglucomutase [Bermanella marisrubri]